MCYTLLPVVLALSLLLGCSAAASPPPVATRASVTSAATMPTAPSIPSATPALSPSATPIAMATQVPLAITATPQPTNDSSPRIITPGPATPTPAADPTPTDTWQLLAKDLTVGGQLVVPEALAVDSDRNVYLAVQGTLPDFATASAILRIEHMINSTTLFAPSSDHAFHFERANGVAVDKNGNVYASDFGRLSDGALQSIRKFSPNGELLSQFGRKGFSVGDFNGVGRLAADMHGDLYAADFSGVQKFSSSGALISTPCGRLSSLVCGNAIAVDNEGNLYATSQAGVVKISPDGTNLATFSTIKSSNSCEISINIKAIAIDPIGDIYLDQSIERRTLSGGGCMTTALIDTRILKMSPAGAWLGQWYISGRYATDMTMDVDGNLYIASVVYKADPVNGVFVPASNEVSVLSSAAQHASISLTESEGPAEETVATATITTGEVPTAIPDITPEPQQANDSNAHIGATSTTAPPVPPRPSRPDPMAVVKRYYELKNFPNWNRSPSIRSFITSKWLATNSLTLSPDVSFEYIDGLSEIIRTEQEAIVSGTVHLGHSNHTEDRFNATFVLVDAGYGWQLDSRVFGDTVRG